MTDIRSALARLDPEDDSHWTSDGMPLVGAVAEISGRRDIRRQDLIDADPAMTRDVARERRAAAAKIQDDKPNAQNGRASDLPILSVLASLELTEKALREAEAEIAETFKRRREADDALQSANRRVEILSRNLDRMQRLDPDRAMQPIRDYLARQTETRELRASKAKAIISSGVSLADIVEQLSPGSKLDRAMNRRRPAIGSQRPQARVPETMAGQGG